MSVGIGECRWQTGWCRSAMGGGGWARRVLLDIPNSLSSTHLLPGLMHVFANGSFGDKKNPPC